MRKRKHLFAVWTVLVLSSIYIACTKDPGANRPNDPSDPPGTPADSATLLLGRWSIIKDSSTNIGNYYYLEGSAVLYPIPGIYWGKPEDHFTFKTGGKVDIYANNNGFNYTYALYPNNKLVIFEILNSVDTTTIVSLSSDEAIFDWNATSPNGGKFFRRSYLRK